MPASRSLAALAYRDRVFPRVKGAQKPPCTWKPPGTFWLYCRQPLPNLVTSELPVIQEEQPVRASCASFSLPAVDRPTSGWRHAQDKGIGPMVADGIQLSAAPEDRTYAQRFRPLPSCGAAAPASSELC